MLKQRKILLDIVLIVIINAVVWSLWVNEQQLLTQFYQYTQSQPQYQLELFTPLALLLMVSLLYFVVRRWHEAASSADFATQHALIDPLTRLYNRRTLESKMLAEWQRFIRYKEPFSFVIFDLDDFKNTNDTLGHKKGDQVIQDVALSLTENTRKTDLLGRWDGGSFLVLCPVCEAPQALILAEKLRNELSFTLPDGSEFSASFGVCQADADSSLEEMIKNTELALQKAKAKGKNCVVCE